MKGCAADPRTELTAGDLAAVVDFMAHLAVTAHRICLPCLADGRHHGARRITDHGQGTEQTCCYCRATTTAGKRVRQAPERVPCGGCHPEGGPQ